MSDTPRCDEAMWEAQDLARSALVVYLQFARQLERELAEANKALDEAMKK